MKIYTLLDNLLNKIEETLDDNPTADDLAASLYVSSVHLQRLFKASFETTLAAYIRSRRLAASLEKLFHTDLSIIDIAVRYGFDYAQSYIRAFRREFGITPDELRKTGRIIKVMPPTQLFTHNDFADGLLFGPEIVFVPGFCCIGKSHIMPNGKSAEMPAKAAQEFWINEKSKVENVKFPETFIGLTKIPGVSANHTVYTPSVRVSSLSEIPEGFTGNIVPSGLCVRFYYVGTHHYMDINQDIADGMYAAITTFEWGNKSNYAMYRDGLYFERIDLSEYPEPGYDGTYCKMEWFSPVSKK